MIKGEKTNTSFFVLGKGKKPVPIKVGQVIAFFEQKKILCAVCLEVGGNKYHFLTDENREISLTASRIIHTSTSILNVNLSRLELVARLREIQEKQKELMQVFSVKDLWEVVNGEGREFGLRELTDLIFNSQASSDHEMALFRALSADRLYFKQKGENFEPRDPGTVEQILLQMEREAEEEREIQEAGTWLADVWAHRHPPSPEKSGKVIELLKEMAVLGDEAPNFGKGKTLLQKAGIFTPEAPFILLVKLGVWEEDENLLFYRYQISPNFPARVLTEVEGIIARASKAIPLYPQDDDLTFLHPLTIDSEYTRDIDDALSIEPLEGGYFRMGVHITDVATFLEEQKEIFREAMTRATSIYLPDQRIPMIPPALSEGICSLIVGEKRRALSFLVTIDIEGRVQEYQIHPSLIQVDRRLSYDSADALLEEGDEELSNMQAIAEKLYRRREDQGAIFIPRPERVIRVNWEKEITILKRDRESPSQKLVAEFMILANRLAAQFLKEKGIPAIYRGQMEPREKLQPINKFDPLQAYRLRRVMNRVEVSTQPSRHAGLGVEAYITLTSPIRRFYDLLTERQILRSLRGEPIMSVPEVNEVINEVGPSLSKVGLVEEQTERYWIFRYLEKRIGSITKAVILDRFPNRYWVHVNEYLLEMDMAASPGRDFVPGDQILVRIEKAHARTGVLKIAPV